MIPYQYRFIVTTRIHEEGYKELLAEGYSPVQIQGFIKSNLKYVIDWTKINIPVKDMDIEPDDNYDIRVKQPPINYSHSEV